jgi:hypothetical protein
MKKLILSLMVTAFAIGTQAGDTSACCSKDGAGCCAATTTTAAKAQCPMAKDKKANASLAGKNNKTSLNKQKLETPKAISVASR